MSFPSVAVFLEERGVTAAIASEDQLEAATLDALYYELPDGMARLAEISTATKQRGSKGVTEHDPDSVVGRQLIRLMTDAIRPLMVRHFDVAFGFYNCCNVVCAPASDQLDLSLREQIMYQTGELAYANC